MSGGDHIQRNVKVNLVFKKCLVQMISSPKIRLSPPPSLSLHDLNVFAAKEIRTNKQRPGSHCIQLCKNIQNWVMLELNDSNLGGIVLFWLVNKPPHPTDYSGQKHNRRHKNGHS